MAGRLVVLDRAGRAVKSFPLAAGLATLGRDAACDIRVLLPSVCPHHATVTVHANETLVRNVGSGTTLVNGAPVSVHALQHGDELALGGRRLRWEYERAPAQRRPRTEPALALPAATAAPARAARRGTLAAAPRAPDRALQLALERAHRASMPGQCRPVSPLQHGDELALGGRRLRWEYERAPAQRRPRTEPALALPAATAAPARAARRGTLAAAPRAPDRALQLALERAHRASMPASSTGGKQVAIVQPQRRDAIHQNEPAASPRLLLAPHRPARRPEPELHSPTKASLWIESRRGRARAASLRPAPAPRVAVPRRALTPHHKIRPPTQIDHTKRAAIMLMTGHTPKAKLPTARGSSAKRTPTKRGSAGRTPTPRRGRKSKGDDSVSILEITDSDAGSARRASSPAPRPAKSALKDPRGRRKAESIKFDLSNLETDSMVTADESVLLVSEASRGDQSAASEDDLTLRYSESPPAPSPRRSIHSRSSRTLERAPSPARVSSAPASPRTRASRGSLIVQKALDSTDTTNFSDSRYSRRSTASLASRRTLEAYSVVDLVSGESDASTLSHYGSAASNSRFSSREPTALTASTPLRVDDTLTRSSESVRSKASTRVARSRLGDSTLASPGTAGEDESPKSSRKSAASTTSAKTRGSSTPEQRGSPEDASTPVLLRSLLGAGRRRTAPARASAKRGSTRSKSLNFAPRGGQVTPTGTVSITQDPVKNKHSSAKKSQSRRSIIDTLEDSTFVRELFNSPVKRKLSQSMTEFEKRSSRARRAPAERRSDLRGVREMFAAGARDDLSDVRGVRALFARGPRNELDDLAGVKRLLARGPRDDLRRVSGVGALFKRREPRNDLANVSGVREALQPKSPRNDLRRVSGVRALFRAEPEDDLTDVRGVRGLFQRKSPKNDLENVSGVRALKVKSPRDDLRDVSGVARLFDDEPPSSDALFDELVGRPVIKATYSKSFTARAVPKPRKSRRASLRANVFPDNVEEWLQKELKYRTTPRGSVSRALQQLSTATVAGASPILPSRARSGAADASLPLKKRSLAGAPAERSAERPGEPRLPLKKRALVHSTPLRERGARRSAADELGRVSPIAPASPKIVPESPKAPKSARKTRAEAVENESIKPSPEKTRARVSSAAPPPKRAKRSVAVDERTTTVSELPVGAPESPVPATESPASKKSSTTSKKSSIAVKKSPVATKKPAVKRKKEKLVSSSPVTPRLTRGRVSPKKSPKSKKIPKPKESPQSKVRRVSLVIPKPSPQLKPRAPRRAKNAASPRPSPKTKKTKVEKSQPPKESPVKARKTRNVSAARSRKRISAEPAPTVARGRKAVQFAEPPKRKTEITPTPPKKARKSAPSPKKETPKRGRKSAPKPEAVEVEAPKGRRARAAPKNTEKSVKKPRASSEKPEKPVGRSRAAQNQPDKPAGRSRAAPDKPAGRTRAAPDKPAARTRAAQDQPVTPARRARAAPDKPTGQARAAPVKPAGRTRVAQDQPVKPARRARAAPDKPAGRSRAAQDQPEKPAGRARAAKRGADASPHKSEDRPAKGKKAAVAEVVTEAPRGRKRKNELASAEKEPTPKKARGRAAAVASAAAPSARARRR